MTSAGGSPARYGARSGEACGWAPSDGVVQVMVPEPFHGLEGQTVALGVLAIGGRARRVVVGHRIEQQLAAQRRAALVAHPQRRDRRHVGAGAVAGHRDARRVGAEFGGVGRRPAGGVQAVVDPGREFVFRAPAGNRPRRRRSRRRRRGCGTCRHACRGCTARSRCRERTPAAGKAPCRAACRCGCASAARAVDRLLARPRRSRPAAPSARCAPRIAAAPHRPAAYASPARRRPCRAAPGSADRPAWVFSCQLSLRGASDEAISSGRAKAAPDCFASLAMTPVGL